MKSLRILLQAAIIAILAINLAGCKDGDSAIVGAWYYPEDPEEITVFNENGTGVVEVPGVYSDYFYYSYDSKNGILNMTWDDGVRETYYVNIDGDTMYASDGSGYVEIYLRK